MGEYCAECYISCDAATDYNARCVEIAGGKYKELIFSTLYSLFAFVVMLPAYLLFKYEILNFVFCCCVIAMAVWNGASFYVRRWAACSWVRHAIS